MTQLRIPLDKQAKNVPMAKPWTGVVSRAVTFPIMMMMT
jgi:hypothetical protein